MEEMIEKIVKRALEDSYFLQDMKKEILDEINTIYRQVDNIESIVSNLDR